MKRALTIPTLLFPLLFGGCLAETASVASLVSSMYTLKDLVTIEKRENQVDAMEAQNEQMIKQIEIANSKKMDLIIEQNRNFEIVENGRFSMSGEANQPIQQYYAYPTYAY